MVCQEGDIDRSRVEVPLARRVGLLKHVNAYVFEREAEL